jgi:hypothetical protein
MALGKKPSIDVDQLGERALTDISAADFLKVLTADSAVAISGLKFWPEKKKYELFVEPENLGGVKIKDLLTGAKEKKKFEIEKPPGELEWRDPREFLRDPAFIREIAREVAVQLRGMG